MTEAKGYMKTHNKEGRFLMKNKLLFLMGLALVYLLAPGITQANGGVIIDIGDGLAAAGESNDVFISITNDTTTINTTIAAFQFDVVFDSTQLEPVTDRGLSISVGDPVPFSTIDLRMETQSPAMKTELIAANTIRVVFVDLTTSTLAGARKVLPAGRGPIMSIRFKAKEGASAGNNSLFIETNELSDLRGESIPSATEPGTFSVVTLGLGIGQGQAAVGQTGPAPVILINVDPIGGVQFDVGFDNSLLEFVGVEQTTRSTGLIQVAGDTLPGQPDVVRVVAVRGRPGRAIASDTKGVNPVFNLLFRVKKVADPDSILSFSSPLTLANLIISDEQGEETFLDAAPASGLFTVVRVKESPVANFTATVVTGTRTVRLRNRSTGLAESFEWDLGDGGSATVENLNHTYALPGAYQVTLRVTGPTPPGLFDTETKLVVVAAPRPSVSSVIPSRVDNDVENVVTVTGAEFFVQDGTLPVVGIDGFFPPVQFVSSNQLRVTIRAGIPIGVFDVQVTNPDEQSALAPLPKLTIDRPAPGIDAVDPSTVTAGIDDIVTITGSNFFNDPLPISVSIDGIALAVTFANSTTLRATVAGTVAQGTYDVTVTNSDPDGSRPLGPRSATLAGALTVTTLPPDPQSVTPDTVVARVDARLTISGQNFKEGATATLGGVDLDVIFINRRELRGTLLGTESVALEGPQDLVVTNPDDLSGTLEAALVVLQLAAPSVTAIDPSTVVNDRDTTFSITGANFFDRPTPPQVSVDGVALRDVEFISSTELRALGGLGLDVGTRNVTVTNPDGQSATGAGILDVIVGQVILAAVEPAIVVNDSARTITLLGANFVAPITVVTIDGTPLSDVTPVDLRRVTATVPAGQAPDTYDVTINALPGSATLRNALTVILPAPRVTVLDPDTVFTETDVLLTITGANFVDGASARIDDGSGNVFPLTPVEFVSGTELRATISGIFPDLRFYDVVVINPDGQRGVLEDGLWITDFPAPQVVGISPDTVGNNVATDVVIEGANFREGALARIGRADAATFGLIGIDVIDSRSISATVPGGLDPGIYDVIVVNRDPLDRKARRGIGRAEGILVVQDRVRPSFRPAPRIVGASDSTLTVFWGATELHTGFVRFENTATGVLDSVATPPELKIGHRLIVGGLAANIRYRISVRIFDLAGNQTISRDVFETTKKIILPSVRFVEGPTVVNITDVTANIVVGFNRLAEVEVQFYSVASPEDTRIVVSDLSRRHNITLFDLTSDTLIELIVTATDLDDNVVISGIIQIRTDLGPDVTSPIFTLGPFVRGVTTNSAGIGTVTSESTTIRIDFGTSADFGQVLIGDETTDKHANRLRDLDLTTTYFFQVTVADLAGNETVSDVDSFATLSPVQIIPLEITEPPFASGIDTSEVTIAYTTNKISDTRILYGTAPDSLIQLFVDSENVLKHSGDLTGLTTATDYFYTVTSTALDGDEITSDILRFRTRSVTLPLLITGGPNLDFADTSSAQISWLTNKPGNSIVEFGLTEGPPFDDRKIVSEKVVDHVVSLTDLQSGTQYFYRVISEGSDVTSVVKIFNTTDAVDLTPPSLTRGPVPARVRDRAGVDVNTVTIKWSTDDPSNFVLRFKGTDDPRAETDVVRNRDVRTVSDPNFTKDHTAILTNLTSNTVYFYLIEARNPTAPDAALFKPRVGKTFKSKTLRVRDATPPTFVDGRPSAGYTSATRAVWVWRTNEPSTSEVFLREEGSVSFDFLGDTRFVTDHSVPVTGLTAGTTYEVIIISADRAGNFVSFPVPGIRPKFARENAANGILAKAVFQPPGGRGSFTTSFIEDTDPPIILTDPSLLSTTQNSVTMSWPTNELSDSVLEFSLTDTTVEGKVFGALQEEPTFEFRKEFGQDVVDHIVLVTDLPEGQTFDFQVSSTDPNDNGPSFSNPSIFSTVIEPDVTPPKVLDVSVEGKTTNQATLAWRTDELANSVVEFFTAGGDTLLREDDRNVIDHRVTLTGLELGTEYTTSVSSTDISGNGPSSFATTFTTATEIDIIPPAIRDVSGREGAEAQFVTSLSDSTASLEWITDELSNSFVDFDTTRSTLESGVGFSVAGSAENIIRHRVTLTGLRSGITYSYKVGSEDVTDPPNVAQSEILSFVPEADVTPPQRPEEVKSIGGDREVFLSWKQNVDLDFASYQVLRSVGDESFASIATGVTDTTFRDVGLENGSEYAYKVVAFDRAANSAESDIAQVDPIPAVGNVATAPGIIGIGPDPDLGRPIVGAEENVKTQTPNLLISQASPGLRDTLSVLTYTFTVYSDSALTDVARSISGITPAGPDDPIPGSGFSLFWHLTPPLDKDIDLATGEFIATTFWWRARANDSIFNGQWSAAEKFVVDAVAVVELSSFTALEDRGRVRVNWVTASERENAGFNIYRSITKDGVYHRLNDELLVGDSPYMFVDEDVQIGRTYYYKLEALDIVGEGTLFGPVATTLRGPMSYSLSPNYPNPFNPETTINYEVPKTGRLTLKIYNVLGQEVKTLVDEKLEPGYYRALWDGKDSTGRQMASGVYFYRIKSEGFAKSLKMMLLK